MLSKEFLINLRKNTEKKFYRMKKTRHEALKKLIGDTKKPRTAKEWVDATSKYEDDLEDIEKEDRKFHVKIIDFIRENKEIIILGIIMTTISLLHSEIYLFFKSIF